jgi:hypothetical protein
LLVTGSENALSDWSRYFFAELNLLLFDIDPADDGPRAQCLIKREHKPDLKRGATAATRRPSEIIATRDPSFVGVPEGFRRAYCSKVSKDGITA